MTDLTSFLRKYFGRSLERHLFVLSGVLFSVGILAGSAIHLERDRKTAYAEQAERGGMLADAAEVQAARMLATVESMLGGLVRGLEAVGEDELGGFIESVRPGSGPIQSITLLDSGNRVLAGRGSPEEKLALPLFRTVQVGSRTYTLAAMIEPAALLPEFRDSAEGGAALLDGDGRVLAATPGAALVPGTLFPASDVAEESRIISRRPVRNASLTLVTSVPAPRPPDIMDPDAPKMKWGGVAAAGFLLLYTLLLRQVMRQRERIEEELESARDAAEQANAARGAFLSTVSHEIRTPLNGVIGMAALLRETPLDAGQEDCAKTIEDSANALLAIVDDVLDFSKIDAGKLGIESIVCPLLPLVEGSIDILAGKARQKNLRLMSHVDPALPHAVMADPVRLRQVLLNLAGNAVKFTPAGEVLVSVRLIERKGGACRVRFAVEDTGIGIDPAIVDTLFTPFSQADSSVTREYGGTGLGLSISRRLVELMGGKIDVESVPGGGALFRFDLDLPEAATPAPAMHAAQRLRGVPAVIVDPHRRQAEVLAAYLGAAGMAVVHAATAAEAIALVERNEGEQLVIAAADLQAPEPGALERDLRIRAPQARLTFVACNEDMRDDAVAQGCRHVLLQPLKRKALIDTVAQVLDGVAAVPASPAPPVAPAREPEAAPAILLVEDNIMNQKVAIRQLNMLGYSADIAVNGQEALDALAAFPYALVLMDCQMPVMDGYETTRRIRMREQKTGGHVQIIAMTANAMRGDRALCVEAGMDDYLSKPIVPGRLAEMLERRLPHRAAARLHGTARVLNDNRLQAICGGDEAFRQEMLELTVTNTGPLLDSLKAAIEGAEWSEITVLAHRLAGSCGNIGIDELAELARDAERACRAGDLPQLIRVHGAMTDAFARLCEFVRKESVA